MNTVQEQEENGRDSGGLGRNRVVRSVRKPMTESEPLFLDQDLKI